MRGANGPDHEYSFMTVGKTLYGRHAFAPEILNVDAAGG
jgi:hypothetical protein